MVCPKMNNTAISKTAANCSGSSNTAKESEKLVFFLSLLVILGVERRTSCSDRNCLVTKRADG